MFQIADLAAQGWLCSVQPPLGGKREAPFLGNGDEITQVSQLHPAHASQVWGTAYKVFASDATTAQGASVFTGRNNERHGRFNYLRGDTMKEAERSTRMRIVLVHGGFVDGSGWLGVYDVLRRDGYDVSVVQNPTISLDGDVAATKRVLSAQAGPTILVGHSYGGVVITEAGNHPTVAGLVYVAAFAPDRGESVAALIKDPPAGAPVPPIVPGEDGYLLLDKSRFAASFAADVAADQAAFIADSQVPWGRSEE